LRSSGILLSLENCSRVGATGLVFARCSQNISSFTLAFASFERHAFRNRLKEGASASALRLLLSARKDRTEIPFGERMRRRIRKIKTTPKNNRIHFTGAFKRSRTVRRESSTGFSSGSWLLVNVSAL
jgi:hypothetical protein